MRTRNRQYQGESTEVRVDTRRRQLLDTAFESMVSQTWREMSISKLCVEAGLNKRYFYESFDDLDSLSGAIIDELSSTLINSAFNTVLRATAQGLSTAELAKAAIQTVVEYLTDDPRRAKVLFTDIAYSPISQKKRKEAIANLSNVLSAYGHYHYEAGNQSDPIAALTSSILVGGTIEAILGWINGQIQMSRAQLIEDLTAIWIANGDLAAERAKARVEATSAS